MRGGEHGKIRSGGKYGCATQGGFEVGEILAKFEFARLFTRVKVNQPDHVGRTAAYESRGLLISVNRIRKGSAGGDEIVGGGKTQELGILSQELLERGILARKS